MAENINVGVGRLERRLICVLVAAFALKGKTRVEIEQTAEQLEAFVNRARQDVREER